MGNYNPRSIRFRQSVTDFPLTVTLGEKVPSWGLSRWGGNGGLRFVPPDDEGFTLRGDKQRLVYKGQRRSHRFTILGDNAFEYDCILLREPESNVVSMLMEGAENFDFFRQPDFVPEPLLKGSYAVYKKETLLGEGTGKLCHIHRPEIVDARGLRCWGDLSIVGNCLCITIPEKWLSEATYPVIVDPTIGTTTIGSQYLWDADPPEPWVPLLFECSMPVNRFLVSETIDGLCTAYFYTNDDDWDAGGRPILYSNTNNQPHLRKSMQEDFINLRATKNHPPGWRSGTFRSNEAIPAGTNIWFGLFTEYMWYPRFDYGGVFWEHWWSTDTIPNIYPGYRNVNVSVPANGFRLSMYFTYSSAQNYVRVLTQGVNLSDSRKLSGEYKRNATETARIKCTLSRFETLYRNCMDTVHNTLTLSRIPSFYRTVTESIKVTLEKWETRSISRICLDTVNSICNSNRTLNMIRKIYDELNEFDTQSFSVLIIRSVSDNTTVTDHKRHFWAFVLKLFDTAGNSAETIREAEYYRNQADTVQAEGKVSRGLLLFVRIVTQVFIRDYLLGRFLKARQELVLKSCVSREIVLESKIG